MRVFVSVYRKEKHLTQEELAFLANVSRETICRLEQGKYNPSYRLVNNISRILDTPINKLFEVQEE